MSPYLPVCLTIHPSVCLYLSLSLCIQYLAVHLPVSCFVLFYVTHYPHLCENSAVHLVMGPSISKTTLIFLFLPICVSGCQSVHLSLYISCCWSSRPLFCFILLIIHICVKNVVMYLVMGTWINKTSLIFVLLSICVSSCQSVHLSPYISCCSSSSRPLFCFILFYS